MRLSLVIPCFNEHQNILPLLEKCKKIVFGRDIEVVIVDNGSTDDTKKILSEILPNYSFVVLVTINNNKGYGNGILEGLKVASGEILAWTHADLQADPADVLKGYQIFASSGRPEQLFVKGKRYGRRLIDVFFTMGMAVSETIFLRKLMWDINAQPTMFHRQFFLSWKLPPDDFSLDLYAYYMAKHSGLLVQRFPVHFGERIHGTSHWNTSLKAKYRFIKRTLIYSYKLKQTLK